MNLFSEVSPLRQVLFYKANGTRRGVATHKGILAQKLSLDQKGHLLEPCDHPLGGRAKGRCPEMWTQLETGRGPEVGPARHLTSGCQRVNTIPTLSWPEQLHAVSAHPGDLQP